MAAPPTTAAAPEVRVEGLPSAPAPTHTSSPPGGRRRRTQSGQVLVRGLAACSTLAAALIMALSEVTSFIGGYSFHADYHTSSTFEIFLYGNAAACLYALLSMFLVYKLGPGSALHSLDMLAKSVVVGTAAAATAVGYIAKKGNSKTGWLSVCDYFENYCNKVGISIFCSYVGFTALFAACFMNHRNAAAAAK